MADPTDGATPTGVPDLNDPNVRLDRHSALKAMMARRRETVLNEMTPEDGAALVASRVPVVDPNPGDEDTDPADAIAAAERARLEAGAAAEPAPTQLERQAADPEPVLIPHDQLAHYRVRKKVNGVETEVPLSELHADAQKVSAADAYLETARTTLAEVNAVRGQLERQQERSTSTSTASPAAGPEPTSSEPDPVDVFVDSLFQGDEAKAKEAMRKRFAAQPAAQQLDRGQLASELERTMVIRSAVRQFAKDHKAIYDEPELRARADRFLLDELRAKGLTRLEDADPGEIPDLVNAAGTRTKGWLAERAGLPASAANAAASVNRRAQKEQIDELPSAAARAASSQPAPKTTSDTIAAMQRARQPHLYPPGG